MKRYEHDEGANLDYGFDWGPWLAETTDGPSVPIDTITDVTWTIDGPDEALEMSSPGHVADGRVTVWLSGGTLGRTYRVTAHIITDHGREDERSFDLAVVNR